MDRLLDFLAGPKEMETEDGETLRLLTAMEVLQARREAEELAQEDRERALCANACLLARALERDGQPVFPSGRAVLEGLRVEEIVRLSQAWGEFNRRYNPSPQDCPGEVEPLKKDWSTRLISAFNGVCSGLLGRCPQRRGPGRWRTGTTCGAPSTWRWTERKNWHRCAPVPERGGGGALPGMRARHGCNWVEPEL